MIHSETTNPSELNKLIAHHEYHRTPHRHQPHSNTTKPWLLQEEEVEQERFE